MGKPVLHLYVICSFLYHPGCIRKYYFLRYGAYRLEPKKSSLVNAIAIILLSLPCVLGYNVWSWDWLKVFGGAILDLEDFLVSNILLPLGSLVYLLFCVSKRGWGWENFTEEANTGKGLKIRKWMRGYITYILPLIILFIFFFGLYDKFLHKIKL